MCESCSEFQQLLYRVEREHEAALAVPNNDEEIDENPRGNPLGKDDVMVSLAFLNIWHQKQCMCVFRDVKNLERFSFVVQFITKIALKKLKAMPVYLKKLFGKNDEDGKMESEEKTPENDGKPEPPAKPPEKDDDDEDVWSLEDTERLLTYMSRVFMLQFPLYLAAKQTGSRLDDLSQAEATSLAVFLDVSGDVADIPLVLLRNVAMFCRSGGLNAMVAAFNLSPTLLPSSTAHGLVSILCNLKLWLNPRALSQLFGPVRTAALQYLCSLTDGELRQQPTRAMADFLWSSIKDNLDSPLQLDKDGLELAFKYFSSPTLTMRLCGINQVNAHISLFNEMCNTESVVEVESVGLQLAQWILENRLVEHIFGPNLHVEVIKQSHVLLNFLAMEGKITNGHMDTIWQAAQLKHCSKQVHDLLPPLIKNLEAGPVLHLYELAQRLPVREHTEQTIYLAQVLQKFIWTSGGTFSHLLQEAGTGSGSLRQAGRTSVDSEEERECMKKTSKKVEVAASESSDEDDISDDVMLQELADLDDDDNDEFSDVDDDDEDDDDDDDLASSDSDRDDCEPSDKPTLEMKQVKLKTTKPEPPKEKLVMKEPLDVKNSETSSSCDPKSSDLNSSQDVNTSMDLDTSVESSEVKSPQKGLRTPPPVASKKGKTTPNRKTPKQLSTMKRPREAKISDSEPEIELAMGCGDGPSVSTKKAKLDRPLPTKEEDPASMFSTAKIEGLPTPVPASGPSCLKPASLETRLGKWAGKWEDPGQGAVMTELANLVGAHAGDVSSPRHDIHDMFTTPFMRGFRPDRLRHEMFDASGDLSDDGSAGEAGSVAASSHISNKSEKNMGDFADEDSADEEMVRLAQAEQLGSMLQHHQHLASMAQFYQSRLAAPRLSRRQQREGAKLLAHYRMDRVAERGNTLLWDLIQDGNIEDLADGLATEAEKALTNLLCYNMERYIRVKFIEGCLSNLEKNVSVVISLRLLPKLFQSFHNFRGMDTHEMTIYTERNHNMTKLFFDNLQAYTAERRSGSDHPFYAHSVQIQVRLHFLAMLFSHSTSPDQFRLTQEQVSILWECLARDPVSSDEMFQWLLGQAHSKDQHALGIDSVKYIYSEKLPELRPETMTMTGLNLLSQLSTLVRISETGQAVTDASASMDQLWRIALQATNTDVSMKAIQILNGAYLGRGDEFLSTCMRHLQQAGANLSDGEDQLVRIHRAILLLKSHLETFRRKYAYHFRRLAIEGQPVSSHAELVEVRHSGPLRIVVQPGGAITEKVTLDMNVTDLVADLRAEIVVWWKGKLGRGAD